MTAMLTLNCAEITHEFMTGEPLWTGAGFCGRAEGFSQKPLETKDEGTAPPALGQGLFLGQTEKDAEEERELSLKRVPGHRT